jgi:hypothetical protein
MPIVPGVRLTFFISIVLMSGAAAIGQATRPAFASDAVPPDWERTVNSLAAAVAGHDAQGIEAMLPAGCVAHRFNAARDADFSAFADFTDSATVLGDHVYLYPPTTAAADIARDVSASPVVADLTKKSLSLNDSAGQSVALQWITESLGAVQGVPMAIIVAWDTRPDTDDQRRLTFVLIQGEKAADGFKISQIVYGDPLQ